MKLFVAKKDPIVGRMINGHAKKGVSVQVHPVNVVETSRSLCAPRVNALSRDSDLVLLRRFKPCNRTLDLGC